MEELRRTREREDRERRAREEEEENDRKAEARREEVRQEEARRSTEKRREEARRASLEEEAARDRERKDEEEQRRKAEEDLAEERRLDRQCAEEAKARERKAEQEREQESLRKAAERDREEEEERVRARRKEAEERQQHEEQEKLERQREEEQRALRQREEEEAEERRRQREAERRRQEEEDAEEERRLAHELALARADEQEQARIQEERKCQAAEAEEQQRIAYIQQLRDRERGRERERDAGAGGSDEAGARSGSTDGSYAAYGSGPGTPLSSTSSKKKKRKDEVDASGRRVFLTDCEIRGEVLIGEKVTAFAKRSSAAKKLAITCVFQWYRMPSGTPIAGAEKASYCIQLSDVGHRLRVVGRPIVRESGEEGQPVEAETPFPVDAPEGAAGAAGGAASAGAVAGQEEDLLPRLTDWKIEMNPRQEYTDPVRIHYQYAGGQEGRTIVEWFREIDGKEGIGERDQDFASLQVLSLTETHSPIRAWPASSFLLRRAPPPSCLRSTLKLLGGVYQTTELLAYQPTLADVHKRIRILITPARIDGVTGPTYQHVLDPLVIPDTTRDEVTGAMRAIMAKQPHQFYLGLVDLAALDRIPVTKRFLIEGGVIKIKHAETDKTEIKCKLEMNCLSADVCSDPATRNKVLLLSFLPSRSLPNGRPTMAFVANSTHDRDIAVLLLRGVSN